MSKFTTIGEVLKDEKCTYFIEKYITHIKFKREHTYGKLKRSPIDFLEEHEMFNAKELINQYAGIVGKKTDLPMRIREFIQSIVRESIQQTIKYYEDAIQ